MILNTFLCKMLLYAIIFIYLFKLKYKHKYFITFKRHGKWYSIIWRIEDFIHSVYVQVKNEFQIKLASKLLSLIPKHTCYNRF